MVVKSKKKKKKTIIPTHTRPHAQRCPVCHGSGKILKIGTSDDKVRYKDKFCHGCGGKGWVAVR